MISWYPISHLTTQIFLRALYTTWHIVIHSISHSIKLPVSSQLRRYWPNKLINVLLNELIYWFVACLLDKNACLTDSMNEWMNEWMIQSVSQSVSAYWHGQFGCAVIHSFSQSVIQSVTQSLSQCLLWHGQFGCTATLCVVLKRQGLHHPLPW